MDRDAVVSSVFTPVRTATTFEETVERLGTAIRTGILPAGSRLPAERMLADELEISRSTLRQALTTLVQSGLLISLRGRGGGTFVTESPPLAPAGEPLLGERWLLCGRIQFGPRTSKSIATAGLIHEPGLDSALMWTAPNAGYVPVFRAGDSVSHPGPEISCLALLDSAKSLGGADLIAALYRGDTKAIPGMRWLTKPEVDVVAEQIDRRALPVDLGHARVALIPRGLAIMGGKLLPVAGIVIATIVKTTLIVTPSTSAATAGSTRWSWRSPLSRSQRAAPGRRVRRGFSRTASIFEEQASSYHRRNGLRLIKTMSNLVVAGVARSAQAPPEP